MKISFLPLLLIAVLSFSINVNSADREITKQEAVEIAKQTYPGRVLAVKHKSDVYKVKTLSASGKVRVVIIDAMSGKIKSTKHKKADR